MNVNQPGIRLLGALLALSGTLGWAVESRADFSPDEIQTLVRAFVQQRSGISGEAVRVPELTGFRVPEDAPQPVDLQLSVHPNEDFAGSTPITLKILAGDREIQRGVVTVNVERERDVLVAARPLSPGSVVRAEDVRPGQAGLARVPQDAIRDSSVVVGQRATRSIPAGAVWREGHLAEVPAVSRGEMVTLRIERGALRIEALGKAREAGAVGERVRVLNVQSRRELVGVVDDDGVVHVRF